jgi:hypothetical protein
MQHKLCQYGTDAPPDVLNNRTKAPSASAAARICTTVNRRLSPLWLSACLLLAGFPAAAEQGEQLHYGVVYRGVFSMGSEMPIADVEFRTHPGNRGGLAEIRLEASSAAYPAVEALYPLRYRFRTWTDTEGGLVAFETYEKTRRLRHRLHLPDASKTGVRRLDLSEAGVGTATLASLDSRQRPPGVEPPETALSDRLGLLQQVRAKPLHAGAEYRFEVTSGSKRLDYRVRVEKADRLRIGDVELLAWKLRFDGDRVKQGGEREQAHRPLYVWLSRDAGQVPLRVDSRHAVGLFRIQLKEPGRLQTLASLAR